MVVWAAHNWNKKGWLACLRDTLRGPQEGPGKKLSSPFRRTSLGSDGDAHGSQGQCVGPWIILDKHISYPLTFTFKDSKQAMLYGTIQLISLVKITF